MNIANQFAKYFFYGITLAIIVGIILPILFSAASNLAVAAGVLVLFLPLYFGIVIAQYEVKKLTKKMSTSVKE